MLKGFMSVFATVLLSAGLLSAHGNATHLMGAVTAVDATHFTFTIKQTDGKSVNVMTDKFTKYLDSKDKPLSNADLKVGSRVVVDAKMDNLVKMYVAEEVRIGVAAPAIAAKTAPTKTAPQKSPTKK
jgi:hypothetical protein